MTGPRACDASPLVRACGGELDARIEESPREERIDHVWITMSCGVIGRIVVSVNTLSQRNREAGFDPRVRIGRVSGTARHFPPRGWEPMACFDYVAFGESHNIFYETFERPQVERLLLGLCQRADLLEAWGAPYRRKGRQGLHQIHSRRASCAVKEDLHGRDGGLCFYFRESGKFAWTMVLTKFCGQP